MTTEELYELFVRAGFYFKKDGKKVRMSYGVDQCTSSGNILSTTLNVEMENEYVPKFELLADTGAKFGSVATFSLQNKWMKFENIRLIAPDKATQFYIEGTNIIFPENCDMSTFSKYYVIRFCHLKDLSMCQKSSKESDILIYMPSSMHTLQYVDEVKSLSLLYVTVTSFKHVPKYCQQFSFGYRGKGIRDDIPYALRLMLMEGLEKITCTYANHAVKSLEIIMTAFNTGQSIYDAASELIENNFTDAAQV